MVLPCNLSIKSQTLKCILLNFTDDGFEGISPEEWNEMLDKVELNDPSQLEVAAVVSGKMAMQETPEADIDLEVSQNTTGDGNDTQVKVSDKFPRTSYEQKVYDETNVVTATSFKLLTYGGIKYIERAKSLSKRYVRFLFMRYIYGITYSISFSNLNKR